MPLDPSPADIRNLAAKLDRLDLTPAEQAILDGILERAAATGPDEVSGFVLNDWAQGKGSRFYEGLITKAAIIGAPKDQSGYTALPEFDAN